MMLFRYLSWLLATCFTKVHANFANDTLGWENGFLTLSTVNFDLEIVKDSQTLASLRAKGSSFDFLPFDLIQLRSSNNQYHIGDVTYRYRATGTTAWIDGDSSTNRKIVSPISGGGLAAANLANTLPQSSLNFTREWIDTNGDLGLVFSLTNTGNGAIEIGSLGFPMEFNSIFTDRTSEQTQALCSLHDPYIGLDAGYVQVTPLSGTGSALVVTPIGNTPFQAWRNLKEPSLDGTFYGSQTFEGYYEWQTLSLAYAENEWSFVEPWNEATSKILEAGETATFGLRFSLAINGVRDIETAVKNTGTPFALGIPGFIVPSDLTAQLRLFTDPNVTSIVTVPANAIKFEELSTKVYSVISAPSTWGRVRVSINYSDGRTQTVHYYITKSGPNVLKDLGNFATTTAWFDNTSDPFGRAPSPLTYDRQVNAPVQQDPRVWIAGLSDEGGAGM
jgi:hypothetical protein